MFPQFYLTIIHNTHITLLSTLQSSPSIKALSSFHIDMCIVRNKEGLYVGDDTLNTWQTISNQ